MTDWLFGPDRDQRWVRVHDDGLEWGEGSSPARTGEVAIACADARIESAQVNAHTHIYSALAPYGMPEPSIPPQNFVQILERVWWRLDRALDSESLRASARLYAAESLLSGTTVLIDHHESPSFIEGSLDVLADACEEIGVRALLCFGATERNSGADEARRGLAECRRFITDNRRSRVRGVVGLHASFTVSDETITEAAQLCRDLDTVMHVHLAEDRADVEDARRRGYAGPLERLITLGALPPGSICAHGVHLTREQVRTQADAGGWIVQNPRSNRGNAVGYPPALAAHPNVALGTDGYPADMMEEEGVLLSEARDHGDDLAAARRRRAAGRRLAEERLGVLLPSFDVALAAESGSEQRGYAADLVVRDDTGVRHVVVDGELVVRDGRLLTADLDELRRVAREQAPLLWERMLSLTDEDSHD